MFLYFDRTYFHRDLSAEDKALIGDCTPKPISSSSAPSSSAPTPLSPRSVKNSQKLQSQWNSSGTWEERDHTKWARDYLINELGSARFNIPLNQGEVMVSDVSIIDGEASVVMIRGKRKFIYDFTIDLTWKVSA